MVAEMVSSVSFATRHSLKCPGLSVSRDTGLFLSQVDDHLLACALRLHRRKAHTLGLASITAGLLSRGTDHFGISGPQPLFELARAQTRRGPAPTDERLREVRVTGDGKCMFRSLALGLAANKNQMLGSHEAQHADKLRLACAEAMCSTGEKRQQYGEALMAVKAEGDITRYCKRIQSPSFWGGEAELLVLSKMLKTPIRVYLRNSQGPGYIKIQEYGAPFDKANGGKKKAVRLLYNGNNHYDLLLLV
eukprot:CAMPEP_0198211268 /NCGR_PEP_ID=MMETSP1445-20131203/22927_1 /TAXON_ID=36898 /ORGANISM="Pyramimonas sp., Strain CCMP2087" /LENGTH=247 /DNA_ID=CAMNT_0043885489 /DNA_START=105 /DNA_END=848 /DNA_ORIENTATION=+